MKILNRANLYLNQNLARHDGDYSAPRYFYIHDRLGSVRQIMDTAANVVKYYTYEPFGEVLEEDGTLTNNMMFTGQYYDTEIDQYYLRARQYDPHISRFTARDPIRGKFEEPMTLHVYLYCQNDPINRIDPFGLLYTPAGGPHYDWVQTQGIIAHATLAASGGLGNAVEAFGRSGDYDYKGVQTYKYTFEIGDPERPDVLTGAEFGNYITSYVTYSLYGPLGLLGTRVGGEHIGWRDDWREKKTWADKFGSLLFQRGFDDVGSKCLIYKGALDAHRNMPSLLRAYPLNTIAEFQLMINYYHYYGLYFYEEMTGYVKGGSFHWGL